MPLPAPFRIHWSAFWTALVAAPLLVTLATFWITPVPYFALIFGGPVYLILGTPLLIWHLRRSPPRVVPIVTLALISLLALVPIAAIGALLAGTWTPLKVLPSVIAYGSVFAGIWSAGFALLYRRLTRAR